MGTFSQAQECDPASLYLFLTFLLIIVACPNHSDTSRQKGDFLLGSLQYSKFFRRNSQLYVCLNNSAHTMFCVRNSCELLKDGLAMMFFLLTVT